MTRLPESPATRVAAGAALELIGVAHVALDRFAHGGAIREALADQFALVDDLLKQQYLWLAQPRPAAPKSVDQVHPGERGEGALAGIG